MSLTWSRPQQPYSDPRKVNVNRAQCGTFVLETYALETGGAERYHFDAWAKSTIVGQPQPILVSLSGDYEGTVPARDAAEAWLRALLAQCTTLLGPKPPAK